MAGIPPRTLRHANFIWRTVLSAVRWVGSWEPVVLAAFFVAVVGIWGFVELTDEVLEGDTQAFDRWVLQSLRAADDPGRPVGPVWMKQVARDVTALGGIVNLVLMTCGAAGFLALAKSYRAMWLLLVASFGGLGTTFLLKWLLSRPRPDLVPHLTEVASSSFPSGHSMMSTVVYLTLGTLGSTFVASYRLKLFLFAAAIFMSGLIGATRVYLGVHYPTDVLAGWAAGAVWAMLCWLFVRYLALRRAIDVPEEKADEN